MKKSSMPGHLIAVLVLLGFVVPYVVTFPAILLCAWVLGALGLPMMMIGLMPVLGLGLFVGCVFLIAGLWSRTPWGPRWSRITAGLLVLAGAFMVAAGLGASLMSGERLFVGVGLDFAAVPLALGGYMLWALGRADVRGWLAEAPGAGGPGSA
jgi:hypothetical protein